MINRLGLVIHWLGFLLAVFVGAFCIVLGITDGNYPMGLVFALAFYVTAHGSGWMVSFILTGNKSIWPWQSND